MNFVSTWSILSTVLSHMSPYSYFWSYSNAMLVQVPQLINKHVILMKIRNKSVQLAFRMQMWIMFVELKRQFIWKGKDTVTQKVNPLHSIYFFLLYALSLSVWTLSLSSLLGITVPRECKQEGSGLFLKKCNPAYHLISPAPKLSTSMTLEHKVIFSTSKLVPLVKIGLKKSSFA